MSTSASAVKGIGLGSLPTKSWSIVAWASVAASSVIITYLLTILLGLAAIGLGLLLGASLFTGHFSLGGFAMDVFLFVVGGTVLWSLLPRKNRLVPMGVLIDLSREDRLRAELEAIANTMREEIPREVYVIPDANAAVTQLEGRRVMLLGLPVLQMLSVSQFRAILAHEFAHFYGGDTGLGPWVFKARDNMARVLMNLGRESQVLSILSRFVIVAVLRMLILGGLVLYWKLFMRVTQYISRRQEFRCDELACYVAGSESLVEGLCNVHRAGAAFGAYWNQVVMPMAAKGFRPQVADGFARFMSVPAIAGAATSALQTQMTSKADNPLDSHPPLEARIRKARALAIPASDNNEKPAATLISDLQTLEVKLLQKLVPGIKASELKLMHWDSAASEVYIPLWRKQTAAIDPHMAGRTVASLPETVADLPQIGGRIPDPPGVLLTREQRLSRAAEVLTYALTLTLVDHGWQLHIQPGQFHLEREDQKLEPGQVVARLRSGELKPASWVEYCREQGIGEWPLTSSQALQTSA